MKLPKTHKVFHMLRSRIVKSSMASKQDKNGKINPGCCVIYRYNKELSLFQLSNAVLKS